MADPVLVEVTRGTSVESVHRGAVAVCDASGKMVLQLGDIERPVFPRSAVKAIQALPLVESGAADALGFGNEELALACASHSGEPAHVETARTMLTKVGLDVGALECGAHWPTNQNAMVELARAGGKPSALHNNCSGKHAGFLTLNRHLGGGPEYVEIDHPVQRAVREAFESVTQESVAGWGVDGCSAPNFACTLAGLARAMQFFAAANPEGSLREAAAARLARAMAAFPEMVAGEGRACTNLMRAMGGKVAVKTGAEGVFVAILPEQKRGIALKIVDGATRASEAAITALLVQLGALDPGHPVVAELLPPVQRNWRGLVTGGMRRAPGFC